MMGAIIGDIVGSRFEFDNIKTKDFEFFSDECFYTDDTVMTLAIADAILQVGRTEHVNGSMHHAAISSMRRLGREYPYCMYGDMFTEWLFSERLQRAYGSYGNGAGMRVSAVAWATKTERDCEHISDLVTMPTHNHPEGMKGALSIALATFYAIHGETKESIRELAESYYDINFTLNEIRDKYRYNETCQGTIPQAFVAFLESNSFEDAIRNAISIGGDSDTLAACTGAIAEAYYGIPTWMREKARTYLDEGLLKILDTFEEKFPPKICD